MTNTFQECINYPKYWGLEFDRLRSDPFEGPANVIPQTIMWCLRFRTTGLDFLSRLV